MYIRRNQLGEIFAISRIANDDFVEYLADDTEELQNFLRGLQPIHQKSLAESDLDMVRVLEDLVGLLIDRSVIRFTDLPAAAQMKLLSRKQLRERRQEMNLLDDDEHLSL